MGKAGSEDEKDDDEGHKLLNYGNTPQQIFTFSITYKKQAALY
jgi:hypothetical protein